MKTKLLWCAGLLCLGACQALSGATLILNPPALHGLPGETVGWGFTVTNDQNFMVPIASEYFTLDNEGIYFDYIFNFGVFQVIGRSPETPAWSQTFDPIAGTGLGSYTINDFAIPGTLSSGEVGLIYDLYSVSPNDPSFNPDLDTIGNGLSLVAEASVLVDRSDVTTPEPGTFALATGGVGLAALQFRRRRRSAMARPSV